jgi:hypothetical protein
MVAAMAEMAELLLKEEVAAAAEGERAEKAVAGLAAVEVLAVAGVVGRKEALWPQLRGLRRLWRRQPARLPAAGRCRISSGPMTGGTRQELVQQTEISQPPNEIKWVLSN